MCENYLPSERLTLDNYNADYKKLIIESRVCKSEWNQSEIRVCVLLAPRLSWYHFITWALLQLQYIQYQEASPHHDYLLNSIRKTMIRNENTTALKINDEEGECGCGKMTQTWSGFSLMQDSGGRQKIKTEHLQNSFKREQKFLPTLTIYWCTHNDACVQCMCCSATLLAFLVELLKSSVAMQEQMLGGKGFLVIGYLLEKVSKRPPHWTVCNKCYISCKKKKRQITWHITHIF